MVCPKIISECPTPLAAFLATMTRKEPKPKSKEKRKRSASPSDSKDAMLEDLCKFPLYTTIADLRAGNVFFGPSYVRGMPNKKCIDMFETARVKAVEETQRDHRVGNDEAKTGIKRVQIGAYIIDTWYLAPYPEEYSHLETLYVCEYCLKYMRSAFIDKRHKASESPHA